MPFDKETKIYFSLSFTKKTFPNNRKHFNITHIYSHIHTFTHRHTHTHTHTHTRTRTLMCVCVCVCIYKISFICTIDVVHKYVCRLTIKINLFHTAQFLFISSCSLSMYSVQWGLLIIYIDNFTVEMYIKIPIITTY